MNDWYCFKDKVKMQKTDVPMTYMKLVQYVSGMKCPQCGVYYLDEYIVMTVVQAAENALEEK